MKGNKTFLEFAGISSFQDSGIELLKNLADGTISRIIDNSTTVLAIDLFLRRSSSATTTNEVVCRISLSKRKKGTISPWNTPRVTCIFLVYTKARALQLFYATLLCHAMPCHRKYTTNTTCARRMMGRLDVLPSNMEQLFCLLIGRNFYDMLRIQIIHF